jgi:hypothetical protein
MSLMSDGCIHICGMWLLDITSLAAAGGTTTRLLAAGLSKQGHGS